ncbi:hypothetical protein IV203_005960 [Nitzschia inconspicua]|uniref:Uncharacterized protein n=1 Tax=Nitzschia inconspicua TaxID=303405 RepID=A0A9K3KP38_9STRA|nr:hypothetical protein IV203_005960 [Nitzschia inconspicua]
MKSLRHLAIIDENDFMPSLRKTIRSDIPNKQKGGATRTVSAFLQNHREQIGKPEMRETSVAGSSGEQYALLEDIKASPKRRKTYQKRTQQQELVFLG